MAAYPFPIQNMNLSYATSDIYYSQNGGLFRSDYDYLLEDLQQSKCLDPFYQDNVVQPFTNYLLYQLPKDRFDQIFSTHTEDLGSTEDKNIQYLLPILAEALLQRNFQNRYYRSNFDDLLAFQAIVDKIFDLAANSLSAPAAPLVAWTRKRKGPFTITATQMEKTIGIPVGVVCLPPEYRSGGLLAWSVMGHEVAGHNFIQDKPQFLGELTNAVKDGFEKKFISYLERENIKFVYDDVKYLSQYWNMRQRIEEIASDVLGILSTGPSFTIGYIGYFRGMSQDGLLKTSGPFEASKRKSIIHLQGHEIDLQIGELSEKVKIKEPKGILGMTSKGKEVSYRVYKIPSGPHPVAVLRPFAMIEAIKQTKLNQESKNS